MKRIAAAIFLAAVLVIAASVFIWNEMQNPPATLPGLGPDLEESALVYEVIQDTPLLIVNYGDYYFMDTVERKFLVKQWPPALSWELTGNWFQIGPQVTEFSADVTSDLGPNVLFGVIDDSRVTQIEIRRDGRAIQNHQVASPGFIVPADSARYGDKVIFLDSEGTVVAAVDLVQKSAHGPID